MKKMLYRNQEYVTEKLNNIKIFFLPKKVN